MSALKRPLEDVDVSSHPNKVRKVHLVDLEGVLADIHKKASMTAFTSYVRKARMPALWEIGQLKAKIDGLAAEMKATQADLETKQTVFESMTQEYGLQELLSSIDDQAGRLNSFMTAMRLMMKEQEKIEKLVSGFGDGTEGSSSKRAKMKAVLEHIKDQLRKELSSYLQKLT